MTRNKNIFDIILALLNGVFKRYPAVVMEIAKIEGLKYYIKGALAVREILIWGVYLELFFILIAIGILLLHAGILLIIFLIAPWSLGVKIAVIFILGIIELVAAFVYLRILFSDKKWVKCSKADLLAGRLMK